MRDIDSLGDVRVMVKDRVWWYNAECLSLITEKSEDGSSEESQLGIYIYIYTYTHVCILIMMMIYTCIVTSLLKLRVDFMRDNELGEKRESTVIITGNFGQQLIWRTNL